MITQELYAEIVDFMYHSGGAYRSMDTATYRDVIDALFDGRYRVTRSDGDITSFTTWWLIHEADINIVREGGKPDDISSGNIVYIADHAGADSCHELIRFIKTFTDHGCWHHRYKHPKQFRQYKKRGNAHAQHI
jgi:hypothetical protein